MHWAGECRQRVHWVMHQVQGDDALGRGGCAGCMRGYARQGQGAPDAGVGWGRVYQMQG